MEYEIINLFDKSLNYDEIKKQVNEKILSIINNLEFNYYNRNDN